MSVPHRIITISLKVIGWIDFQASPCHQTLSIHFIYVWQSNGAGSDFFETFCHGELIFKIKIFREFFAFLDANNMTKWFILMIHSTEIHLYLVLVHRTAIYLILSTGGLAQTHLFEKVQYCPGENNAGVIYSIVTIFLLENIIRLTSFKII